MSTKAYDSHVYGQEPARIRQQHRNGAANRDTPTPAPEEHVTELGPVLDTAEALATALRCAWALADQDTWFPPSASAEILAVALGAVREDERDGYVQRLKEFTERHRERLERMLAAYGPGSAPAAHGRYALVGLPESLIICERMETMPFLLRSRWEGALEGSLLDDLEFAWGPRVRLSR
ncbi:hypothetical protein [Streptomyces zaomyceticus]|uniref:hypothetical protein n=1 Tax=Streptomyces zaomyceticus TaxID=68286 RepID=UPI0036983C20